jgi:hypothetical protein
MQSSELVSVLQNASILAGSTKSEAKSDLQGVLSSRLSQYYAAIGKDMPDESGLSLEAVQFRTATEALDVVEQVQSLVNNGGQSGLAQNSEKDAPQNLLGTRDLSQIRTLLSLVFKWAVEPPLSRVSASIPSVTPAGRRRTTVDIIDLTSVPEDYETLASVLPRIIGMILPAGVRGSPSPTHIASAIIDGHLSDVLRPCLVLGWLPKSLASESVLPLDDLRPLMVHLINMSVLILRVPRISLTLFEGFPYLGVLPR